MFTLVNVARRMGVDSESALRDANRKFSRRFAYMEKLCRERALDLGKLSFDEQNLLWKEAKKGVKEENSNLKRQKACPHDLFSTGDQICNLQVKTPDKL